MNNHKDRIEQKFPEIELLLCVEAGSRAWGFSSPDSDYGVRFIYRYKDRSKYLCLDEAQQVLNFTENNNGYQGWDIKKALRLASSSNASLYEWTNSPIVYYGKQEAFKTITASFSRYKLAMQYRGMAENVLQEAKDIKSLLHALRAIISVKYIYHDGMPPVLIQELLDSQKNETLKINAEKLIAHKVEGSQPTSELVDYFKNYIERQCQAYSFAFLSKHLPHDDLDENLDAIYRQLVGRCS